MGYYLLNLVLKEKWMAAGQVLLWIIIVFLIFFFLNSIKVVHQARVLVIERLGKYNKTLQSGLNLILPVFDTVRRNVDLREQVDDYPPQHVITKDNVSMSIDAVLFFQVVDPFRSVYEIANLAAGLEKLTMTTLRNIVGDLTLDETLVSREKINTKLRDILDDATDRWGMRVNRVEIKNIITPMPIQEAMQKQMVAERDKRANILQAEGFKQAAILKAEGEKQANILQAEGLRQATILKAQGEGEAWLTVQKAKGEAIKIVFDCIHEGRPTKDLISIKYLEALEKIADGKATKIFLPFEASGVLGAVAGIKEILSEDKTPPQPA